MTQTGKTITFGEIMARLCPPGYDRIGQAVPGKLEATFAGAEVNVAVSIAYLGGRAGFVTTLPDNPLGDACLADLRSYGVDVSEVRRCEGGRLGVYYVERGAGHRPGRVVYDREHSSAAEAPDGAYDWGRILSGAGWFHFSGVTPAISRGAAAACLAAVTKARELGIPVSCDLNFRESLWRWEEATAPRELARKTLGELLPFVDTVIGNEGSAADMLNIRAGGGAEVAGSDRCPEIARRIVEGFPGVRTVALTLRESVSASHNNWGAMLYGAKEGRAYFAPLDETGVYRPYGIRRIVDRVGTGDAFAAGLIFALRHPDYRDPEKAVAFAAAASCLAHTVEGDFNLNRRSEVEALMAGSGSGRIER